MSSTYSNLKIQLMGTGDNATTWGNVTNVNLGTAMEEAIVGSADVAFSSADVTLTLTNTNATQSARNVRLNLTGAAVAGYNLIVPAIEKPYIINNGTTGTITVKNATGTGIAVPTGKTMWVFNDGTNVKDVTTHLTSLTLGAFLPIASGGTGGNTAANARTALSAAVLGANSDITSLSGLTTALSIAQGGTGSNTAPLARTALGATTVGGNMFILTNPSAITFPRFNADNTVTALDAATFRTAIGAGTSSTTGTVTSVGGTGTVNGLTLTGTVTSSGSLTLGGTLSSVSLTSAVTGTLPIANGGTGSTSTTYCSLTANVTDTLPVANGGTGLATTPANGALDIGNGTGFTRTTLTAGSGVSITNSAGGISIAATGSGGTVTSTSVVSANGFAGTVATATTTPAITLTTTITGVLKGNGTAISAATAGTDYVAPGGALGTPSSGTLTNCTFPTLNQSTTGSAATLTTARTFTIGATGKTFNGSANVSWTLGEIGAAASGANGDITSLTALTSIPSATTINSVTVGYRSIPRSTTTTTAAVGDVGKCIAVTANIAIPNSTFAAGDAVSIYNDSASSITITASITTLRLAGTAFTGNRTLAARGMATVWFNSATEAIISGSGVT